MVPFQGESAPSSVAVYSTCTFWSFAFTWSTVAVTLLPLNVYVAVLLLFPSSAGSNFDFAVFSFHVPANDCVGCATTEFGSAAAMSTRLIRAARRCMDIFVTSLIGLAPRRPRHAA